MLLQNPELTVRRLIDVARQRRGDDRAKDVLTELKKLLARVFNSKGQTTSTLKDMEFTSEVRPEWSDCLPMEMVFVEP